MLFIWALAFILVLQEQAFSGHRIPPSNFCSKPITSVELSAFHVKTTSNGESTTSLATADPVSVPPGSSGRSDWCNEHNTIHRHLDAIEEQVEKTVEYLESEVKTLLKDISEMACSAPIALGTPLVDIFDDSS